MRLSGLSIRVLVTLLVVLPIAAVAAALVGLSSSASRGISEQLGASLIADASARVRSDLSRFLSGAVRVSDLYERRVRDGVLPTDSLQDWERFELDDLVTSPDVASISFGSIRGDCTWVLRNKGRLEVGRADGSRLGAGPDAPNAVEYEIKPSGQIAPTPIREYRYDPRERPWYKTGAGSPTPVWTPVYFWFGEAGSDAETGTGYVRAIRSEWGEFRGVLVIDVTLGGLSEFLRTLPLSQHGALFIVDERALVVAASEGGVNSPKGERLPLSESASAAGRAAATVLGSGGPTSGMRRVKVESEPVRATVTRLRPYPGIDWRLIALAPERVFLGEAQAARRRLIWVSVAAALGAVLVGVFVSRRISGPLLRLVEHVRKVGGGDFETRLELRAARELTELSGALNTMAGGLKQRMQLQQALSVAEQVQNSLLPASAPAPPGLEVWGRSKYCETTGGDYYDFLDVTGIAGGRLLLAVGDVMGHGVGSALLMASARAALRARAVDPGSVADMMGRVNEVLSRDARHERFMTMLLMVMDPQVRSARWAGAGHDPPIIYEPTKEAFRTLEGGDMPLGIMTDVRYEEYEITDLTPGSVIVLGTDGIWEAQSASKALFGKAPLEALIRRDAGKTAEEIGKAIEEAVRAHCAPVLAQDDVTMVVMRLTPWKG